MSERTFFTLRYALPGYTFILLTILINFHELQGLIETEILVAFLAFLYLLSGSAIGFLVSQSWYFFYNYVVPQNLKLKSVQTFLRNRFRIRLDSWSHFSVFLDYMLLLSHKEIIAYTQRRWDLIHTLGSTLFATLIGSFVGVLIRADLLMLNIKLIGNPIALIILLVVSVLNCPTFITGLAFTYFSGYDCGVICIVALLFAVLAYGLHHVWIEHDMMSEIVLRDVVDSGRFSPWLARRIFPNEFFDSGDCDRAD